MWVCIDIQAKERQGPVIRTTTGILAQGEDTKETGSTVGAMEDSISRDS